MNKFTDIHSIHFANPRELYGSTRFDASLEPIATLVRVVPDTFKWNRYLLTDNGSSHTAMTFHKTQSEISAPGEPDDGHVPRHYVRGIASPLPSTRKSEPVVLPPRSFQPPKTWVMDHEPVPHVNIAAPWAAGTVFSWLIGNKKIPQDSVSTALAQAENITLAASGVPGWWSVTHWRNHTAVWIGAMAQIDAAHYVKESLFTGEASIEDGTAAVTSLNMPALDFFRDLIESKGIKVLTRHSSLSAMTRNGPDVVNIGIVRTQPARKRGAVDGA